MTPTEKRVSESVMLMFYDIWVAHGANGRRMVSSPPFVNDPWSQERIAAGLPIAVHCCWNGLVNFAAKPFADGLRMRKHEPGECACSECELMCHDFKRLGLNRAVIDPCDFQC